jgi:hypothetical protein
MKHSFSPTRRKTVTIDPRPRRYTSTEMKKPPAADPCAAPVEPNITPLAPAGAAEKP